MRTASLALLLAALAAGCASRAPVARPLPSSPSPEPSGLIAKFAECVGVLGPTRDLPVASHEILETGRLATRIRLPAEALVMDGYQHWLHVDWATGRIHIVQIGGFAGFLTVFGPFTEEDGCLAFPPPGHAPWFWDLASASGREG